MLSTWTISLGFLLILLLVQSRNTQELEGVSIDQITCNENNDLHVNLTLTATARRSEASKGVRFYKYKVKTKHNAYQDISTRPNGIILHNKCPSDCVKISVKYMLQKNATFRMQSGWSAEKEFCKKEMPTTTEQPKQLATLENLEGVSIDQITCQHNNDLHVNLTLTPSFAQQIKNKTSNGVGFYKYKVRTKDNNTYEDLSMKANIIIMHNRCPRDCVNVSVKYMLQKNATFRIQSKWSAEKTFCGKGPYEVRKFLSTIGDEEQQIANLEVLKPPKVQLLQITDGQISIKMFANFSSFPSSVSSHFQIGKIFENGQIKKTIYEFSGRFVLANLPLKHCVNISFQTAVITKRNVNYIIYSHLTEPKIYCTKGLQKHEPERPMLSTLLSCLVPTVVILLLVVGAFASYYRKKQLEEDLAASDSSLLENKLLKDDNDDSMHFSRSNSGTTNCSTSSETSTPMPLITNNDCQRQEGNKPTKLDNRIYTTNKDQLSKLYTGASL